MYDSKPGQVMSIIEVLLGVIGKRNIWLKDYGDMGYLTRLCSKRTFKEPEGLPTILARVPSPPDCSPKN